MDIPASDVAFSPAVKAVQSRRGSRAMFAAREAKGIYRTTITPELAQFIAARDSFFLATASASGQPYLQHRGGPKGFLRVLGERQLGFADFRGNRQYVTAGNLQENDRVCLFLIDYAHRHRVKLWGRARAVEDPALISQLILPGYRATPEQAILIDVAWWDPNCSQHIPQLFAPEDLADAVDKLQARVAELEAELQRRDQGAAR